MTPSLVIPLEYKFTTHGRKVSKLSRYLKFTSMAIPLRLGVLLCVLASLSFISYGQTCANYTFTNHKVFNSCSDLPYLNAHLHWNYIPSSKSVEIAYIAPQTPTGWVAWGINPSNQGMIGTQGLVAFWNSNASLITYPIQLDNYGPSMQPTTLSFPVSNISAEYANNEMIIFAVLGLLNGTTVNHTWQAGDAVSGNIPQKHDTTGPSHLQSTGVIDFLSA